MTDGEKIDRGAWKEQKAPRQKDHHEHARTRTRPARTINYYTHAKPGIMSLINNGQVLTDPLMH